MKNTLPKHIAKFFWGDDLSQLDWSKHQNYIIKTLLENGDKKEISWLLSLIKRQELKRKLRELGLSPKSENFWRLFLK